MRPQSEKIVNGLFRIFRAYKCTAAHARTRGMMGACRGVGKLLLHDQHLGARIGRGDGGDRSSTAVAYDDEPRLLQTNGRVQS